MYSSNCYELEADNSFFSGNATNLTSGSDQHFYDLACDDANAGFAENTYEYGDEEASELYEEFANETGKKPIDGEAKTNNSLMQAIKNKGNKLRIMMKEKSFAVAYPKINRSNQKKKHNYESPEEVNSKPTNPKRNEVHQSSNQSKNELVRSSSDLSFDERFFQQNSNFSSDAENFYELEMKFDSSFTRQGDTPTSSRFPSAQQMNHSAVNHTDRIPHTSPQNQINREITSIPHMLQQNQFNRNAPTPHLLSQNQDDCAATQWHSVLPRKQFNVTSPMPHSLSQYQQNQHQIDRTTTSMPHMLQNNQTNCGTTIPHMLQKNQANLCMPMPHLLPKNQTDHTSTPKQHMLQKNQPTRTAPTHQLSMQKQIKCTKPLMPPALSKKQDDRIPPTSQMLPTNHLNCSTPMAYRLPPKQDHYTPPTNHPTLPQKQIDKRFTPLRHVLQQNPVKNRHKDYFNRGENGSSSEQMRQFASQAVPHLQQISPEQLDLAEEEPVFGEFCPKNNINKPQTNAYDSLADPLSNLQLVGDLQYHTLSNI